MSGWLAWAWGVGGARAAFGWRRGAGRRVRAARAARYRMIAAALAASFGLPHPSLSYLAVAASRAARGVYSGVSAKRGFGAGDGACVSRWATAARRTGLTPGLVSAAAWMAGSCWSVSTRAQKALAV